MTINRIRTRRGVALIAALSPIWLLALLLSRPTPARAADGVVQAPCDDAAFETALAAIQSSGGGTLTFNCGADAGLAVLSAKIISTNVTIDGDDQITLGGGGFTRLFEVIGGGRLTLRQLTLAGAYDPFGGDGGAVFNEGVLIVDHCTFRDNQTTDTGNGGAIYSAGPLTITASVFEGNLAANGGALYLKWGNSRSFISQSVFQHNATYTTTDGMGGAMLLFDGAQATLTGSDVFSNTGLLGGGIHVFVNAALTLTSGSQVRQNWAAVEGGGIFNAGFASLTQAGVTGNQAPVGGGIGSPGELTVKESTIRANTAITGAGVDLGGMSLIQDSLIVSNTAVLLGGGLHTAAAGFAFLSGSQFLLNAQSGTSATPEQVGGGAIANAGGIQLDHSLAQANTARHSGAGLFNYDAGTALIIGTTFSGNLSDGRGGAIHNAAQDLVGNGATVEIHSSTLSENAASYGGGLYNANAVTTTVTGSTVNGNVATIGGAGIFNGLGGVVPVLNSTISGNRALFTFGGGLDNAGRMVLRNATLSGNDAPSGGGLYTHVGAATIVTNTVLAYSPHGGNCAGEPLAASKFSLSSDGTCGLSGLVKGMDPNGLDPLLTALGNYGGGTLTHMLKLGSPAIDGVIGPDTLTTDQRGQPRPNPLGSLDIGAVERQAGDSSLAPRLFLPFATR